MRITDKKVVFFDLDHTLWDFEKNSALAFEVIIDKYNIEVSHAKFNEYYSPINARYWKLYRDGNITQQELRYGRLKDTFSLLGFSADDVLLETISQEYIRLLPENKHLFEGAIEILEYLKPKYSLHIITNGPDEVQERKMKNANIGHYFETVTNSELAGCKKPHAGIFEFALKAANAQRSECIMIGDCIEADIQGAIDCGIEAIFFNEHNHEAPASIKQINHLLEIKNIL